MNLTNLLQLIEEMPAYQWLLDELEKKGDTSRAAVLDAAKPYLIAALHQRLPAPTLIVTTQPESARRLYEQLLSWSPALDVKLFPEPESLPYEFIASDTPAEMERLQALASLANLNGGNGDSPGAPIVITPATAFMQKVPPAADFISAVLKLEGGTEIE